jgi:hypothetical protein
MTDGTGDFLKFIATLSDMAGTCRRCRQKNVERKHMDLTERN